MNESTSHGSSNAKYVTADVIQSSGSDEPRTATPIPRRRTVTASDSQKSVQLRFAPREVCQSEAESRTT